MKLALLIVALFLGSSIAQQSGTLGVASSVTANTDVTINYGVGGPSLVIRVNQNAQVTLSAYANVQTTLPRGFSALSFGAQLGFTLSVSPANTVILNAELTTPPLTLNAAALITGGVSAGCLQFDSSTQAYSQVNIDSYSAVSREIVITLPESGTYVFVAVQQDVPIPTFYNQARQLAANVRTQLSYAAKFVIDVTAETSTDITVTFSSEQPSDTSEAEGYTSVNAFFEINLSTSSQVAAVLNYTYDEATLQAENVVASALEWGFFDEQSGSWNFEGESKVDTNAKVVSKSVNHFSTWGVYASSGSTLVYSFALFAILALFL